MPTTIAVSKETRDQLMKMKIDEGASSLDELLSTLIVEHRKLRFLEASQRFRGWMDDAGMTPDELLEQGGSS